MVKKAPTVNDDDENDKSTTSMKEILCPLAGDDPMVYLLWRRGYSVTAMDLVPVAMERMREQFSSNDGEWTTTTTTESSSSTSSQTIWSHSSGRALQYVGDALQVRPELRRKFDAVYDKDSFGALPVNLRQSYCARLAEYTKPGGIVYMEVKYRDDHDTVRDVVGPPFSMTEQDILDDRYFGTDFDYVANLGTLYGSVAGMKQTGHILRRKKKTD